MPFWYRTMCEELFCISILIYQDEDGNSKNNLLNIEKKLVFQKGDSNKTQILFIWILLKINNKKGFMRSNKTVWLVK